MSFSLRSSGKRHYKNAHHGSGHYQKKGFFNSLFDIFASRSSSHGNYYNYGYQNNRNPMFNQPETNQNSIGCSKCHSQIPAGSKFCLQCGERVASNMYCLSCGEKLPSNAKFCLICGCKIG